jgi:hypothetical protein
MGHSQTPYMALLFKNAEAARVIFERWRARFGTEDKNEEIAISIIRNLPDADPHHYLVQITSNPTAWDRDPSKQHVIMASRSLTMEPKTNQHLDMFLGELERSRAYHLLPAVGLTNPKFFFNIAMLKHSLTVKLATDINESDIESVALRIRGHRFC